MTSQEWYKESSYFHHNNLEINYKRNGTGEALLCLHGFPTSSWDFAPMWKGLNEKFDTIIFDLIGMGKSDKPNSKITVGMQADVAENLLLHFGIKEAHIFAHDLGDTVAQELLARQENNTNKINWKSCTFMNGGLFPESHQPRFIQKLLLSPIGGIIAKFSSKKTFQRTMNNIFSKEHPPTQAFIDESWELMIYKNGRQALPHLIRYMTERKINRERWVSPLANKIIPMRMINGTQDPISGRHLAERFQEIVPDAEVIFLENAGHYPHVEVADEVLGVFLKSNT